MDLGTFLMNKHHEPTQVGITLNGIIIKLILRNILSQMSIKLHSEISDIMDDIKIWMLTAHKWMKPQKRRETAKATEEV